MFRCALFVIVRHQIARSSSDSNPDLAGSSFEHRAA